MKTISKIEELCNSFSHYDKDCSFIDYIGAENNEICYIKKLQDNRCMKELIWLWDKKCKNKYFELEHPLYSNIVTRAVYNFNDKFLFNFVFMVDEECLYPWAFIQFRNLINGIIMPNKSYYAVTKGWDGALESAMLRNSRKIDFSKIFYKKAKFGFTFENSRPAHFFFELLASYMQMDNPKKNIFSENMFFKPSKLKKIYTSEKNNCVYLFPATIVPNINIQQVLMRKVFQESLSGDSFLIEKKNFEEKYDLVLWIGLPGERRFWFEQIKGIADILNHLNNYFKRIKVYIDGMTAYDGEKQDFPENKVLFNKVVDITRKLFLQKHIKNMVFVFEEFIDLVNSCSINKDRFIVFKSLEGYDYRSKIYYCNECNIAIGDAGTTALVPFDLCAKPGVIMFGHTMEKQVERYRLLPWVKIISKDYLITKNINGWSMNYHIPIEYIYNLTTDVLEELSVAGKIKNRKLKMYRLDVPSVELVAKQYELEQKLQIDFPMESVALYSELEKKINTLALCNNTTLNQVLENINTNNTLKSISQHSLQGKDQIIQNLENKIKDVEFKLYFKTAKSRIQNQLSYKLGQAMIVNSKSILGYIRMPFVLSYIKDKHKQEQKIYQEKIKKDPSLKLPPLEDYPDYQEALKEKECLTYKLGQALIQANKTWYKGGYIKLWFEIKRLKDGI
ncbi:hypothetical protein L8T94_03065 [Campylobacter lari]|nr:hypothetical protein [Campylobacter lari]